ncbi:MAG TPA: hypothetical protein DDZ88_23020 [Verrucomicrobiales bacterium]|nr:hypothetical protein [Verrucomicrobiales bacterium]
MKILKLLLAILVIISCAAAVYRAVSIQYQPQLGMSLPEVEHVLGHALVLHPTSLLLPTGLTEEEMAKQLVFYSEDEVEVSQGSHERSVVYGFNPKKVLIEIRTIDVRSSR